MSDVTALGSRRVISLTVNNTSPRKSRWYETHAQVCRQTRDDGCFHTCHRKMRQLPRHAAEQQLVSHSQDMGYVSLVCRVQGYTSISYSPWIPSSWSREVTLWHGVPCQINMEATTDNMFVDILDIIASEEDGRTDHLVCTVDFETRPTFTERTIILVSASFSLILLADLKM